MMTFTDTLRRILTCMLWPAFAAINVIASENVLVTIYQPLDPMVDGIVVVREVPFVTGGPFPEVLFQAITQPHLPQQSTPSPEGDINVASRAGIALSCESAGAGKKELLLVFDLSKAKPGLLNEELIRALLACIERTADKTTTLHSRIVGAEKHPLCTKLIQARIKPE